MTPFWNIFCWKQIYDTESTKIIKEIKWWPCLPRHCRGPINAKTREIFTTPLLNAVQITKSRCISGQTISCGHKVLISLFSQVIARIFCLSDVVGLSAIMLHVYNLHKPYFPRKIWPDNDKVLSVGMIMIFFLFVVINGATSLVRVLFNVRAFFGALEAGPVISMASQATFGITFPFFSSRRKVAASWKAIFSTLYTTLFKDEAWRVGRYLKCFIC